MAKLSILSAMEYTTSFWAKIIGMFFNDVAIGTLWYIMFLRFPEINGWHFADMLTLFALVTTQAGIMLIFAGGVHHIAKTIMMGELDYYLSFPKPVLWHLWSTRTDIAAIGDLLFGLFIFFFFRGPSLTDTVIFLLMALLTAAILLNIMTILHTFAFYFHAFEEVVHQYYGILLGFAFVPQSVFTGSIKTLMQTVFPIYFLITLPAQIMQQWNWHTVGVLFLFWFGTFIFALKFFNHGLKRYESGNLINVRI
ncbi:MAG: ABC-2 family transporter protein [Candidatus Abawacabacteria bacterium]|nr:ABC-2 family transporter protein [Candidatus Abawacabacteria bacterium]